MKEELNIKLVVPSLKYKEQVMAARRKFLENKETFAGCAGLEEVDTYEEWIDFDNRLSKKYGKEYVPSTVYLGVRAKDDKVVGIIDLRYPLSDFLFNYGGNIGYSIFLEYRKKGYATEMLRLLLEKCKELETKRVLITCDKENIASAKVIKANGGELENEVEDTVKLSESGIIQRYWITFKKRYENRHKLNKPDSDLIYLVKSVNDDTFKGDISYYNFKNANIKLTIPNGRVIIDNHYKLLGFFDYSSKIKMTAFYDKNNEIIEWYFDIARKIGKENGVPYEDDLYLDVVLKPNGEILLLDEDELKEAFERREMTEEEYQEAYNIANDLIERINGNERNVEKFTDKYLKSIHLTKR